MASRTVEIRFDAEALGLLEGLADRLDVIEERLAELEARSPYRPIEFAARFGTSSHPHTPRGGHSYVTRGLLGIGR